MPAISVKVLRHGEESPYSDREVQLHYSGDTLDLVVLEGGMAGGNPSVALVVDVPGGLVIIETSLLAYQASARAAVGMAEAQFGWTMPP
jgi:hypothetical protein